MLEQFKRLYHEKGVRRFYIGGAMGVHIWAQSEKILLVFHLVACHFSLKIHGGCLYTKSAET